MKKIKLLSEIKKQKADRLYKSSSKHVRKKVIEIQNAFEQNDLHHITGDFSESLSELYDYERKTVVDIMSLLGYYTLEEDENYYIGHKFAVLSSNESSENITAKSDLERYIL